jgi:hypothetical protein
MATTYNFTDGSLAGQVFPPTPRVTDSEVTILKNILDFSRQNIEAGASDVAQALIVPADTTVLACWMRVITAETANATVDLGYGSNADQWGGALNVDATGIVPTVLEGSVTWDASAIADGDEEAKEIPVTGAALGDAVIVVPGIDVTDLEISGTVTDEDTVTVILANNTGAEINLASMTITAYVDKAPMAKNPVHFAAADTIDITATVDNGDVDLDGLKVEVSALVLKQVDTY